jgi:hypothetical protein
MSVVLALKAHTDSYGRCRAVCGGECYITGCALCRLRRACVELSTLQSELQFVCAKVLCDNGIGGGGSALQ